MILLLIYAVIFTIAFYLGRKLVLWRDKLSNYVPGVPFYERKSFWITFTIMVLILPVVQILMVLLSHKT